MAYRSTNPLNTWLGNCDNCVLPVRFEVEGDLLPATESNHKRMTECVECGGYVWGIRLWGEVTDMSCDSRCMGATGPCCSCACGGSNHGKWWGLRTYREVLESKQLRQYRAEQLEKAEKREAKRQAKVKREAEDKRAIYDAWAAENADVIDYLKEAVIDPYSDQFLADMVAIIGNYRPLTPRQADAVRRVRDARAKKDAQREAERKDAKPIPTGRLEVTGTVVSTKSQEGDWGSVFKMLVRSDDGWKVWTTLPRDLLAQMDEETRQADPHGRGYTTTIEELKNRRVRFTVTITPSKDDPIFGFGSRPSKAELLPVG